MEIAFHMTHGYWGGPEDFDPLETYLKDRFPGALFLKQDLRNKELSFAGRELSFSNYRSLPLPDKRLPVYIGYSLGGRLLTQHLLSNRSSKDTYLFFGLASACGLASDSQKKQRSKWEDKVLHKIDSYSIEEFFAYWSSLNIFSASVNRKVMPDWSKQELKKYFECFRLSQWGYFLEEIKSNPHFNIFVGEKDIKYREMYQTISYNTVKEAGHRLLLDNPKDLAEQIAFKIKQVIHEN